MMVLLMYCAELNEHFLPSSRSISGDAHFSYHASLLIHQTEGFMNSFRKSGAKTTATIVLANESQRLNLYPPL